MKNENNPSRSFWFLVLIAYFSLTNVSWATESHTFQVNAAHDGSAGADTSFAPPLVRKWARELQGLVSYPVVSNGMVFVTVANSTDPLAFGSRLFALSLRSGRIIWEKPVTGDFDGRVSNLAVDGGRLFLLGGAGYLHAYSADEFGRLLWMEKLRGQYSFTSAPTPFGGVLFMGGGGTGGTVYAVDQATGKILWTTGINNGGGESSPAVTDSGVYVASPCQHYGYDRLDGHELWHYAGGCTGGGGSAPVYSDGRVYSRDDYAGNLVFDARSGSVVGSFQGTEAPALWQAPNGATLLIERFGKILRATNARTGKVVWTFHTTELLSGAALVVNGYVLIASKAGTLYMITADTGTLAWSEEIGEEVLNHGEFHSVVPDTGLGIADGTIIIPATNKLIAYGPQ